MSQRVSVSVSVFVSVSVSISVCLSVCVFVSCLCAFVECLCVCMLACICCVFVHMCTCVCGCSFVYHCDHRHCHSISLSRHIGLDNLKSTLQSPRIGGWNKSGLSGFVPSNKIMNAHNLSCALITRKYCWVTIDARIPKCLLWILMGKTVTLWLSKYWSVSLNSFCCCVVFSIKWSIIVYSTEYAHNGTYRSRPCLSWFVLCLSTELLNNEIIYINPAVIGARKGEIMLYE
jgi:hypothetical protein